MGRENFWVKKGTNLLKKGTNLSGVIQRQGTKKITIQFFLKKVKMDEEIFF